MMNSGRKTKLALLLCFALMLSMFSSPEQLMAKKVKLKLNKKNKEKGQMEKQ